MKTKKVKNEQEKKGKVKDKKMRKVDENKQTENIDEKTEQLTKEIMHLESMYNKALATAAHHENQARYYKNEFNRSYKYRSFDLIERLLPILDSFHFAFSAQSNSKEVEAYKTGFEYIYIMFKKALEDEGATEIVPNVGDQFDHNIHNAVETEEVEDDDKVGLITKVVLNGYSLHDRVIRPANVVVSTKKVDESNKNEDSKEDSPNDESINESKEMNTCDECNKEEN